MIKQHFEPLTNIPIVLIYSSHEEAREYLENEYNYDLELCAGKTIELTHETEHALETHIIIYININSDLEKTLVHECFHLLIYIHSFMQDKDSIKIQHDQHEVFAYHLDSLFEMIYKSIN